MVSGWVERPSGRKARLPDDWSWRRGVVLADAGFVCALCGGTATEVDHILRGDDHRFANLQALCGSCHRVKSAREGAAAAVEARARVRARFRRKDVPTWL